MRIIIAGAGDVGFHIAKLLSYENQDITIVDTDTEKLNYASNQLDVATISGNAAHFETLKEANIAKADLLITVTNSEETNIASAILGKHLGAEKTIARISNIRYREDEHNRELNALGIDELISPESLASKEIERLLEKAALTDKFDFDDGLLSLIGIHIHENDILLGKTISEASFLNPDLDFLTVAILRNNETIIPRGDTVVKNNDHVYFIAQPSGIERIAKMTNKEKVEIKDVMIIGSSKLGYHAAQRLEKKYRIKLICEDKKKAFQLADELKDVLVINGDLHDVKLLEEEGLNDMDAFIAVTDDSETNMIASLVAKNHGVEKTVALVENIEYIHLSQNIGVDTLINKKLIAANFIFRYIRKGEIVSIASLHGVEAEVLEFEVKETSKITEQQLKKLGFPKGAIVGGVIRNGQGLTALGDFKFKPKDRVVVLSRPECIEVIENFFN
ncbi:MAG: Trk system potassium transporter TrkA [Bacteroidia bacterium]|nr:Trk system potassium transporter TrkA [Bacteroidia bacterium]